MCLSMLILRKYCSYQAIYSFEKLVLDFSNWHQNAIDTVTLPLWMQKLPSNLTPARRWNGDVLLHKFAYYHRWLPQLQGLVSFINSHPNTFPSRFFCFSKYEVRNWLDINDDWHQPSLNSALFPLFVEGDKISSTRLAPCLTSCQQCRIFRLHFQRM